MKRLLRAAGVAMLGALAFAGAADAQISEPGPYYSLPSWDQQLPASTRWITLTNWGNAAVLDRETGLVWQQDPGANFSEVWAVDVATCQFASSGGRNGWRLPAAEELSTLLDPTTGELFSGAPFNFFGVKTALASFWTATTYPGDTSDAFLVSFGSGGVAGGVGFGPKTFTAAFWCVRGYQGTQNPQ